MQDKKYNMQDLIAVMERLTAPDGCPWDSIQTHDSLKRYLIEECYEVIDAIDKKDSDNLCEELGDVLLQVVFHSVLAKKEGLFDINDVVDGITAKMINRHRHIFGDVKADTPEEVAKSWDEIKKEEKGYENDLERLRSVPPCLPALMRSEKVLSRAEKINSSVENVDNLYCELETLIKGLKEGKETSEQAKMEKIGKILLLITNISRKNEINPEFALTNALETYINKFGYVNKT